MINIHKDERLVRISHRASYYAFVTTSILTVVVLFTASFLLPPDVLVYRAFMFIPWCAGLLVYTVFLFRGGYFATVRDETTQTRSGLRDARLRLALQAALFAVSMFSIKRFFPGSNPHPVVEDISETLVVTIVWIAVLWWIQVRRSKSRSSEEN